MPFFFFLFFSLLFPVNSFAQSSTTDVDPAKTETIIKGIEKMATGTSTVSTNTPKSIFGTISKIMNNQISVNYNNEAKTLTTTSNTVFTDTKQKKIKFENVKPGQVILSMGYYDETNNFEAKRVIITSLDAIQNKNEIIYGTIADISKTSNVLVLIPVKNKNTQYQIKIDSKTEIVDKNGTDLTIDKLKFGQKIVVVIQPDVKIANTFDVSRIITLNSDSISPTPTVKK